MTYTPNLTIIQTAPEETWHGRPMLSSVQKNPLSFHSPSGKHTNNYMKKSPIFSMGKSMNINYKNGYKCYKWPSSIAFFYVETRGFLCTAWFGDLMSSPGFRSSIDHHPQLLQRCAWFATAIPARKLDLCCSERIFFGCLGLKKYEAPENMTLELISKVDWGIGWFLRFVFLSGWFCEWRWW